MPFLGAQSAMPTAACGSVKLVRTMNGEASVMLEVAAAMTTSGVLDWVAIGAVARASGVRPKPASTVTFSLTTSSCAMRLVTSGTTGVVLDDQLHLLARHRVAVLRHVQPGGGLDLFAGRGEGARHRQDQADLEGVLRQGHAAGRDEQGGKGSLDQCSSFHGCLLRMRKYAYGSGLREEEKPCCSHAKSRVRVLDL